MIEATIIIAWLILCAWLSHILGGALNEDREGG